MANHHIQDPNKKEKYINFKIDTNNSSKSFKIA